MDVEIKTKLLAGLPLKINNITLIPLSLKQIAEIGYSKYNMYLSNLIANPGDFNLNENVDIDDITTWDIIISNMIYGLEEYKETILSALRLFIHKDINFHSFSKVFYYENIIIDKENFTDIQYYLKIQNCIKNKKNNEEFNPANDKAEEIKNKILKARKKTQKNEQINFDDLVSVLASNGNGLNILNIWDLTMYQFDNQFSRMQMLEKYDIDIRQLLAGADPKEVKLQYYVRPIDN